MLPDDSISLQPQNSNSIYTGGIQYVQDDEETTCIRCGHDAEKARALGWPAPTMPKPGYIHCKVCSPEEVYRAADHNPTPEEEARRVSNEIRDCFFEDTRRGEKGGGGGGSGRRRSKRPGEKFSVRFEQEWQGFIPINENPEIEGVTTSKRIEKVDIELNLLVPSSLRDELMNTSKHRGVTVSVVIREAMSESLGLIEKVPGNERGGVKSRVRHMVSKGERQFLAMETLRLRCSLNELVTECLNVYFFRKPI